jgi:hypothetical protein
MNAQQRVLHYLHTHIGKVCTHANLTFAMGGDGGSNRLESLISKLRDKGHDIRNERGVGYMLVPGDWRTQLQKALERAALERFVPVGCWFEVNFIARVNTDKTVQFATGPRASWPADPSV